MFYNKVCRLSSFPV